MAGESLNEGGKSSGKPQERSSEADGRQLLEGVLGRLDRQTSSHSAQTFCEAAETCTEPMSVEEAMQTVSIPPTDRVESEIGNLTGSPAYFSHAEILSNGPAAFSALDEEIQNAKHSIDINMFSWAPDSTGNRLADELIRRAEDQPPVSVTIRLDAIGAFFVGKKPTDAKYLPELIRVAGDVGPYELLGIAENPNNLFRLSPEKQDQLEHDIAQNMDAAAIINGNPVLAKLSESKNIHLIIEPSQLRTADHSKVFVFDNKTTISGGMNIGDNYSGGWDEKSQQWGSTYPAYWKDYMVRTKNDPTALVYGQKYFGEDSVRPDVLASTSAAYRDEVYANPDDLSHLSVLHNEGGNKPDREKQITTAVDVLMERAEKTIDIEHAYIMDQHVVNMLLRKARQGVSIRIVRSQPESPSQEAANEEFFRQLMDVENIKIVKSPWILHTKMLIVDGKYTLVGSANLNTASLQYHEESAMLVTGNSPLQQSLQKSFEDSFTDSKLKGDKLVARSKDTEAMRKFSLLLAIKAYSKKLQSHAEDTDLATMEAMPNRDKLILLKIINTDVFYLIQLLGDLAKSKIRIGGTLRDFLQSKLLKAVNFIKGKLESISGLERFAVHVKTKFGSPTDENTITEAEKTVQYCDNLRASLDSVTDGNLRAPTNNALLNSLIQNA